MALAPDPGEVAARGGVEEVEAEEGVDDAGVGGEGGEGGEEEGDYVGGFWGWW